MDVPVNYSIIDKRQPKDLTTVTFTGYKKVDVIRVFEEAIKNNKIENACNWLIELHISGKLDDIWRVIFFSMSKFINIENPYLPSWLWIKYNKYKSIIKQFNKGYEYESRNNQETRNMLVDMIIIITCSEKNKRLEHLPKINNFSRELIENKIISRNLKLIKPIIDNEQDDKDIILATNEIANNLRNNLAKVDDLIYWYCWLMGLEKFKKKNGIAFLCKKRKIQNIDEKYYNDWNWIIWKIIFNEVSHRFSSTLRNEINALFNIYKWKYSNSTRVNKQYIIYHAFMLLKYEINWRTPLIKKYEYRVQACCNINQLYRLKTCIDPPVDIIEQNNKEIKEEKEFKETNEIVKQKPQIYVNTNKSAKYNIKMKDNENEKKESNMLKKLSYMNNLIFYK